jgi:limonene-1,2-epoxide hydrolase
LCCSPEYGGVFHSPLAVNVDLYTGVDSVFAVVDWASLAVLDADINVLAIAVVATGSVFLSERSIVFPSSALNSDLCVCGDFGVGGLVVPVG